MFCFVCVFFPPKFFVFPEVVKAFLNLCSKKYRHQSVFFESESIEEKDSAVAVSSFVSL